ncbi:hypothetical protein N0V90_007206 [Kalmusia sp. IMI 367209]|nr:hypothetical protein N0V90_007206 [Kalmusia sp. IMI 367209]
MATTASPHKSARTFVQTWDETDTAFLDPTSLRIAKVPRAWDRKQEVKVAENGKQKKVWRRYTTRSRAADTTSNVDEESDARARAVKRLQRMSPKAIEKATTSRFGRTHAFKGTRYDRRKSVLPRKKAKSVETPTHSAATVENVDEEEQDTTITDLSNDSFSETHAEHAKVELQESTLLLEDEDRRATFTFLFQEDEHVSNHDTVDDYSASDIDTTSAHFDYPELPLTNDSDDVVNAATDHDDAIEASIESTVRESSAIAHFEPEEAVASVREPSPKQNKAWEPHMEETEQGSDLVLAAEITYPSLPTDSIIEEADDRLKEIEECAEDEPSDIGPEGEDALQEEEFTEASLQLHLQQKRQIEVVDVSARIREESPLNEHDMSVDKDLTGFTQPYQLNRSAAPPLAVEDPIDDITSGLTLGPALSSSREPTPRRLRSPSPPPRTETGPEDATMTLALDDDTALLKDFLSRAAASKANKAANIARRESLQNRRDSDVVRHALASPRKVLEDKDPNSPSKCDNDATLDLSQTLTLNIESPTAMSPNKAQTEGEVEDVEDSKSGRTSRRSSRARKSRLPALSVPTGPPKIAVRRADGGEPVVLKKTDAQELSLLTRNNTRKNKQGAAVVSVRLLKLNNEARTAEDSTMDSTGSVVQVPGKKYVRWDSQLAYFQEDPRAIADMLAEAESLATPDELSLPLTSTKPPKVKVAKDKNATPKVRKVKNLGSANGTPGRGLLAPGSLLPDSMLDKEEQKEPQRLPKPKSNRVKKMPVAGTDTAPGPAPELKLPMLEIAPVGIDPTNTVTKEHKSRLAAPKKVKLPQLSSAAVGDGKENARMGIAAGTPKKGIPLPSVVIPSTVGMETGLPRRRGRKL